MLTVVLVFSLFTPSTLAAEGKLIKDQGLEEAIKLNLGYDEKEELTKEDLLNLTELYIWPSMPNINTTIKDLSGLENAVNLNSLSIVGHEYSDLTSISTLENLEFLRLSENPNIKDLEPLSNLTKVAELTLENNGLTSIEGIPTESLVYLNVYGNKLTSLDGLDVKDDVYYYFELNWNQINDISALKGIKKAYIDLSENNISDISALKDLQEGQVILYGNNLNENARDILNQLESRGVGLHVSESDFDSNAPETPSKPEVDTDNKRVAGASRYHTAVEISEKGWANGSADTVIIARGDSFPDALAGATLAYEKDAPILLTGDSLHQVTKDEIERLGAKNAIVLGGEAAVSKKVVNELKGLGLKVDRVAGSGRYETAVDVAQELNRKADTAILAYGLNFPDALAIAPYAAEKGYPILLTEKDQLSKATKEYLAKNKDIKNIIIVGGTGVISQDVQNQLKGYKIERIAGQHRFDTAAKIAAKFGNPSKAYIANGSSFADALTGAVLAAKEGAPLLLVETDKLPSATQTAIKNIDTFTFLGGDAVISEELKNQILP